MNGLRDDDVPATAERRLTILYATQTGNAQDLAESLTRHAIRLHFTSQCLSMEDYNFVNCCQIFLLIFQIDLAEEPCVVFIVSTTGDGENPDSMKASSRSKVSHNLVVLENDP